MREGTRNKMREKMRRRSKRGPNNSESTGKIGQEIPSDQPAALRPSYPPQASGNAIDAAEETEGVTLDAAVDSADGHAAEAEQGGNDTREAQPGSIVLETQPESLGTPPAEAQPVSAANAGTPAPKGYVVLAIGLPGSGKTTWYKRRGVTPLSSDMLRTILFDDITDQRYSGLVFSTLRSLLRARLIAKMPWNYVDATNLSAHERRQWIKMAKSFGYEAQAVFFDVPLALCMERNSKRDRRVADDVMQKMAERLRPPSFREGFTKITVVRVKGQPGQTHGGAVTPEHFNAPVSDDSSLPSLDEPSGTLERSEARTAPAQSDPETSHVNHSSQPWVAGEGRASALADHGDLEGRAGTLSDVESDAPNHPEGRMATLGSPAQTSDQDQPDPSE